MRAEARFPFNYSIISYFTSFCIIFATLLHYYVLELHHYIIITSVLHHYGTNGSIITYY